MKRFLFLLLAALALTSQVFGQSGVYQTRSNTALLDHQVTDPIQGNFNRVFNVVFYGAVGDSSTDDTAAIQAAISAAEVYVTSIGSGSGNAVIYFPPGVYRYHASTSLTTGALTFYGQSAKLMSTTNSNYPFIYASGKFVLNFDGLIFDGDYSSGASTGLLQGIINLQGCGGVCIRNCTFENIAQEGIWSQGGNIHFLITGCTFNGCFCGIWSNWDGTNSPSYWMISHNQFQTGLGATTTNFSGAIKISGAGIATAPNFKANMVISDNNFYLPGQMGIELNGGGNNSSVSDNTIYGAGFGISFANINAGSATGNTINACDQYGSEMAAGCTNCTWTANNLDGTNSSGAGSSGTGMSVVDSTDTTITGGTITGYENNVVIQDAGGPVSGVNISDVTFNRNHTGSLGTELSFKTISNFSVKNCHFVGAAADTYTFLNFDSTDGALTNGIFSDNIFIGAVSNQGVTFYVPGTNVISGVNFIHNNTKGVTSWGSNAVDLVGSASTYVQNCRFQQNFDGGTNPGIGNVNLNFKTYQPNFNVSTGWQGQFEDCVVEMDSSSGAHTWTLPTAVGQSGYTITLMKSDSSGNASSFATVNSEKIFGMNAGGSYVSATSYACSAQGNRVTIRSDGTNWAILQAR